jgi:chromosome segregation ATPase
MTAVALSPSPAPAKSPAPLADRIIDALTTDVTAKQAEALLGEVAAERSRLSAARREAEATAYNPRTRTAEAEAARAELERLAFAEKRLGMAVEELEERLGELRAEEAEVARAKAYDEAVAARDAMAAELAEAYPEYCDHLVNLIGRVAVCDAQIARVNQNRPEGRPWITGAEATVRGLDGLYRSGPTIVGRLVDTVRLPALDGGKQAAQRPLWPPPEGVAF